MNDNQYLKRIFQVYYREKKDEIPIINGYNQREFGFIPWEKFLMVRHIGYESPESIRRNFIINSPRHIYSSAALYLQPEIQKMEGKKYLGCDLIFDIDVDHFYTPCKDTHDVWKCKECGKFDWGMRDKCPKCGKLKIKKLNWVCPECLNIAKDEIKKILYNFLIPDFGISEDNIKINFSGNRGYHLKVESEQIRKLSSNNRRELADYISGMNISFDILGLTKKGEKIYGLSKRTMGWSQKILNKMLELLKLPPTDLENILSDKSKFGLTQFQIRSLVNYKDDLFELITKQIRYAWAIEGFTYETWKRFLKGITQEVSAEIDIPVTIDIHRLIRYPGSLHGGTGFKVQEISINELDGFNPLNENNMNLDPIVFQSKGNIIQKIKIIEDLVPETNIKGKTYGPYKKGEEIEVPHHIAVFLLCKEVVKTI